MTVMKNYGFERTFLCAYAAKKSEVIEVVIFSWMSFEVV